MKTFSKLLLAVGIVFLGCSDNDNRAEDLRQKLIKGQWTVIKLTSPLVGGAYLTISDWDRDVFKFQENGRYSVVYYNAPIDTTYIEGLWAIRSKPFGVDFQTSDTVFHVNYDHDISRLVIPPPDWRLERNGTDTLQVELILADTLSGDHMILVQ